MQGTVDCTKFIRAFMHAVYLIEADLKRCILNFPEQVPKSSNCWYHICPFILTSGLLSSDSSFMKCHGSVFKVVLP
jgi:hypothetical protein